MFTNRFLRGSAERLYQQYRKIRQSTAIRMIRMPLGRLRYILPLQARFRGAFATRDAAVRSVRGVTCTTYDDAGVASVNYEVMCRRTLWDYPVLFWIGHLIAESATILDAGGHMGTKYRAFRNLLPQLDSVSWVVYDVPAIVRAGQRRADEEGRTQLRFVDSLDEIETPDILLASGLLQYLDTPFADLVRQLDPLPEHILLNKVALRDGPTKFTLEDFGVAQIPYQIRNRDEFLKEIAGLDYRIVDEWRIPDLDHEISTHPELGRSQSCGFYLRRTNHG